MHTKIKSEEFISSQNNINLEDTEYFRELNNCENGSVENWKALTWKCFYCNHIDSSYEILQIHLQSMHQISEDGDVNYQCNDCEESVTSYASFLNHVRCVHYGSLKLCCDICNEILSNYKDLGVHREEHIETSKNVYPVVFHCSLCETVHSTEKELKSHIQISHSLICSDEKFQRINSESLQNLMEDGFLSAALAQLKDEYHETEQNFKCGLCVKTFLKESDFQMHMNSHDCKSLLQCETCSRTFTSKYALRLHIRIHTGERPYKCELCSKTFIRKEQLKAHMRAHTEERLFKCEICLKGFKQKSTLKVHFRIHSEERPFKCELCEKLFRSKEEWKLHMRIHTGERPYKCEICARSFVQKAHLRNHLHSHSADRLFKCDLCKKSFKSNAAKYSHTKKQHSDRKQNSNI